MHYLVQSRLVKSELTAKPRAQASQHLRRLILQVGPVEEALDYGCGKLRYAPELIRCARRVTFVDSEEQLSRAQLLFGKRTTVREYVSAKWPEARVMNLREVLEDTIKYNFVLCANVLPIIPSEEERVRALRVIAARLSHLGQCLLVSQYRNSEFKRLPQKPNAIAHLDGWLLVGSTRSTFFGLLDKYKMVRLARKAGLEIKSCWIEGQSAYLLCGSSRSAHI